MQLRTPSERDPFLRLVRGLAAATALWHRATVDGLEHLPKGPALLVGNHGLFGLETLTFFYLLHRATGRFPIGMTDRVVFGAPPIRALLERVGGVLGTRAHATALLGAGHMVVCYPGGSREVFKAPAARYRLRWERATGFARIAIGAQVPVIPFAGIGVDDSYINLGHAPGAARVFGRYAVPMAMALGPVPLPVRFQFRLGEPMQPPREECHAVTFKHRVQAAVERLLGRDSPRDADAPFATPALAPVR